MDANDFLFRQAEKFLKVESTVSKLVSEFWCPVGYKGLPGPCPRSDFHPQVCYEADSHCRKFCDDLTAQDMELACKERCTFLEDSYCK